MATKIAATKSGKFKLLYVMVYTTDEGLAAEIVRNVERDREK